MVERCAECHEPIADSSLVIVNGGTHHAACFERLVCGVCDSTKLSSVCHYCENRKRGLALCGNCGYPIEGDRFVDVDGGRQRLHTGCHDLLDAATKRLDRAILLLDSEPPAVVKAVTK